jgi:predicted cobalt transporter CbtA
MGIGDFPEEAADVTVFQAWLLVGIPALALGLAMFVGRSAWRSMLGYAVLIVGFGVMTAFDRASGAVFGAVLALIYAGGRGGTRESEYDRMTATSHDAVEAGG